MFGLGLVLFAVVALAPASHGLADTSIYCSPDGYGDAVRPLHHPVACATLHGNQSLAEAAYLQDIQWHDWDHAVATATAITRVKDYDPYDHVRLRAYRRVRSCKADGKIWTYSRLKITSSAGSGVLNLATCDVSA